MNGRTNRWRGLPWLLLIALVVCCAPGDDEAGEIVRTGEKLYSQFDEELIIRDFFQDRRDGFFVDVGAWEWKKNSTTYYLEEQLGWSGIAIDALPELAAGFEMHRPKTKFFNYIVTDHSGTEETLYVVGPMSSTDEDHHKSFPFLVEKQAKPRPIQVPTITLNELLEQNGVSEIDFLSMDIEGSEPAALRGFDIERFRPALVCIEAGVDEEVKSEIARYFDAHGYVRLDRYLKHDWANWYYAPRRDWRSLLSELADRVSGSR